MTSKNSIGLMSGTSMDGIDMAILRTDGVHRVERGPSMFVPYERAFRSMLARALETARAIGQRTDRPGNLGQIEAEITDRHAKAVGALLAREGLAPETISVVGFHGQTVLHRPNSALTVQLGDGPALANAIGVPVVYDMRANDMLHGGQGAPLVPAYHDALARSLPEKFAANFPFMFVNIGGISNVTWIGAKGDPVAFDSGPGNTLIDQWVEREGGIPFDDGGSIGSEGIAVRAVVETYLANSFFAAPGPKSLDRNDFTLEHANGLDLADGARSLATVTAEAIFRAADHVPERPKLWIICGGGRKNMNIINDIKRLAESDSAQVILAEEAGLNGDSMEAEAWAYLAVRSLGGLPLTYPSTTGCRKAVAGGVLAEPARNTGSPFSDGEKRAG
jgi:anhydro-N-acetylmuramic acid kinase